MSLRLPFILSCSLDPFRFIKRRTPYMCIWEPSGQGSNFHDKDTVGPLNELSVSHFFLRRMNDCNSQIIISDDLRNDFYSRLAPGWKEARTIFFIFFCWEGRRRNFANFLIAHILPQTSRFSVATTAMFKVHQSLSQHPKFVMRAIKAAGEDLQSWETKIWRFLDLLQIEASFRLCVVVHSRLGEGLKLLESLFLQGFFSSDFLALHHFNCFTDHLVTLWGCKNQANLPL